MMGAAAPLSPNARALLRGLAADVEARFTPGNHAEMDELTAAGTFGDDGSGLTLVGAFALAGLLAEAEGITPADVAAARALADALLGRRTGRRPRVPLEHAAHAASGAPAGLDDPTVERALFLDVLDAADAVARDGQGFGGLAELSRLHRVAVFARDWLTRHHREHA